MTTWIGKEDNGFTALTLSKDFEKPLELWLDECRFTGNAETGISFYMIGNSEGQLAKKDGEKTDWNVKITPTMPVKFLIAPDKSDIERAVLKALARFDPNKAYGGKITFSPRHNHEAVLAEKVKVGNSEFAIPENDLTVMLNLFAGLTPVTTTLIDPSKVTTIAGGRKGYGGGGNSGQSEADRLKDRLSFVKAEFAMESLDALAELLDAATKNPLVPISEVTLRKWEIVKSLLG